MASPFLILLLLLLLFIIISKPSHIKIVINFKPTRFSKSPNQFLRGLPFCNMYMALSIVFFC